LEFARKLWISKETDKFLKKINGFLKKIVGFLKETHGFLKKFKEILEEFVGFLKKLPVGFAMQAWGWLGRESEIS